MSAENSRIKIRTMWTMLSVSVLLMVIKLWAYFITGSNAILTDAMESIINIVAGGFALSRQFFPSERQ